MPATPQQRAPSAMARFGRALDRGLHFGGTIGFVLALGALTLTGAPLFAGGFAGMLGVGGLNAALMAAAEIFSGAVIGAAGGAAAFSAGHVLTHSISGLPQLLGDAPPRYQGRSAGEKAGGKTHQRANAPSVYRPAESDDHNYGFRRMLEEQRLAEEQRAEEMGR